MLRKDIVEAVERGEFHIWAIEHVTEAIELFTGKAAGEPSEEGSYPIDTIFGIAQAKLNSLRK
ncbi:ATP-dependent protease La type II [Vibrio ishigakensis]|nr:ATP-dependent protease La type II [Vibrio ishigakensis]